MNFNIEAVVDVGEGMVEVRARLEDGRQAILTTAKAEGQDAYREVVGRYLGEAFPPEAAAEGGPDADG